MFEKLRISLFEMAMCFSEALDLVSPKVVDHHKRVASLAFRIAGEAGFAAEERGTILIAGLLHDLGAVTQQERLEALSFELDFPQLHAERGYQLLQGNDLFSAAAAAIIRFHRLPWGNGNEVSDSGTPVPFASHVVHLADRIACCSSATGRSSDSRRGSSNASPRGGGRSSPRQGLAPPAAGRADQSPFPATFRRDETLQPHHRLSQPVHSQSLERGGGGGRAACRVGKGYPFRYSGENLPLGARIMSVADIFTALSEDRPYRRGMPQADIARTLEDMARNRLLDDHLVALATGRFETIDAVRRCAQSA